MPKTKGKPSHKYKKYMVEDGKVVRLGKTCPKCGPGVFLADHEDRWHCGRCGYTEFKKKEEKQ